MTEADKRYNAIQRMNRTAAEYGFVVKSERENTLAWNELQTAKEHANRGWKKLEEAEEQITKLQEEIERLKMNDAIDAQREIDARPPSIPKEETLNFDDANYEFFWAAQDGDVVFWKVPVALYALPLNPEENDDGSRVQQAFMDERFGEEWGSLSGYGIRTMDLATLEENEY